MTERADVVVIGAGHNGLACAAYLAKAGLYTRVVDTGARHGGMAAPIRFGNGFRLPGLAHVAWPLARSIRRDLALQKHGYSPGDPVPTIALAADGRHLVIGDDAVSGPGLASSDRDAYAAFRGQWHEFTEALAPLLDNAPPRLKNIPFADRKNLARLAWKLRVGLGRDSLYEFLRLVAINIHDVLDERFDDERLKGALAAEAVMGSSMGPRTPGTVLTSLQWYSGRRNGPLTIVDSEKSNPVTALARAAENAGASIRCDSRVTRILTDRRGRVSGVELADGNRIHAPRVVSGADPKKTLTDLVGGARLDAMFAHRAGQIRSRGSVGKLLVGLDAPPEFDGLDRAHHRGRLLVAPTLRDVERAFNPSKYGQYPEDPVLDITVPSLSNPSLAPEGHHVMSVNVAFLPSSVSRDATRQKAAFAKRLIDRLDRYAPGLSGHVVCTELLTPTDIEERWHASGGHWHHGELSIHQSFMMRPLHGAAQYATPIEGLYLCSAGCHPGGGLHAIAGRNAAKRVLADGATR